MNTVVSIGSSLAYNQFLLQQEFYKLFMKKCPELKFLDIRSIKHQIFYFPEANTRLESLCELKCDTSIDSSYFYGLARICQYIQRLIILNVKPKPNSGISKLIEVQKNLKYFEWIDDFDDVYNDLEILKIDYITIDEASIIIENSGGHLKEVSLKPYNFVYYGGNFSEESLIFIHKIYENCPLIEYLSLTFSPSKDHFTEFELLLKVCQHLKSLLLVTSNIYIRETEESTLKNGEELLKILIRSAPINLRELRFFNNFKFSLEALEEFLEKWRGRPSLSILSSDSIYEGGDYKNLINKYKNNGVIKAFRCESILN
ncbi:1129_t:CDS:2, partial [Rhizophagus irregularis]